MELKDGTRLHVETEGDDDPRHTLIFTHGFAVSLRTWDHQRGELRGRGLRKVFYDHRGFGGSTPWAGETVSINQLGSDLGELVDAAPASTPITLVGHSMGTLAIIALAAHRSELFEGGRVSGVVLIGSPGRARYIHAGLPLSAVPLLHRTLPSLASRLGRSRSGRPLVIPPRAFALAHGPRSSTNMRRGLADQVANNRSDTLAAYLRACLTFDTPSVEALDRTRVEIIHGTSDHLASIRGARELAGRISGATFHELPRCGHMVQYERAPQVNRIIESLVDKIDQDRLAPSPNRDTAVTDLDMPSHSKSAASLPTVET